MFLEDGSRIGNGYKNGSRIGTGAGTGQKTAMELVKKRRRNWQEKGNTEPGTKRPCRFQGP
eukprot:2547366-Pyramimonas_sp.AAC.1